MRGAVLGAAVSNPEQLRALVHASTTITHTDPRAFHGALAIALAARCSSEGKSARDFLQMLQRDLAAEPSELVPLLEQPVASAERGETTPQFAVSIGCERGVSGYVLHTVPVAIHAWASNPCCYRDAVLSAILCGGDTDTVAACAGGIVASRTGVAGIPADWRDGLLEWPRSLPWIERLARSVHAARQTGGAADGKAPAVGGRSCWSATSSLPPS